MWSGSRAWVFFFTIPSEISDVQLRWKLSQDTGIAVNTRSMQGSDGGPNTKLADTPFTDKGGGVRSEKRLSKLCQD